MPMARSKTLQIAVPWVSLVDGVAAQGVVGGDAALAIGRAGQRNHGGEAADQVLDLDGVADGVDVGVGGPHVLVHDDAPALADGQAGFGRELDLRPDADGEDDQAAGDDPARAEPHLELAVPVFESP